jgi:hypothetical protein
MANLLSTFNLKGREVWWQSKSPVGGFGSDSAGRSFLGEIEGFAGVGHINMDNLALLQFTPQE